MILSSCGSHLYRFAAFDFAGVALEVKSYLWLNWCCLYWWCPLVGSSLPGRWINGLWIGPEQLALS